MKYIDLYRSKTKRERIYIIVLSIILSISTVGMTRMHCESIEENTVWGLSDVNYVNKFGVSAIVLGCFLFFAFMCIIYFAEGHISKFICKICPCEKEQKEKKIIVFWTCVIFGAWLPYYLSYYPGGVYSDTLGSINYVMSDTLTNRHPLFYTMLIGFFIHLGEMCGKNLTWSIGLFTAIQMLVLGCEFLYFVSWLLRYEIKRTVRIAISLFWIFFPLIPLYSISVWKDTPFCMAILFWMMFLVDLYFEINTGIFQIKTVLGFVAGGLLVAFTRNNGIYVVLLLVFVLVVLLIKNIWTDKSARHLILWSFGMIGIIFLIQGPVYNMLGVEQTDMVEKYGIPLQQIGAVVTYDGVITEEQKAAIDKFIPYENIKEHYSPLLVDDLKWYSGFDKEYFEEHESEFLKIWWQLLKQNPSRYITSYMLATVGFWNVDVAAGTAYVQADVWSSGYDIVQTDYFSEWFGFSFRHFVDPRHYISCAWFFWIFFVAAWFIMKRYGWKSGFLFIPQLGIWGTLMVATPVATSLRYIAASMFTLPFAIIVPMLLERQRYGLNNLDGYEKFIVQENYKNKGSEN